MDKQELFERAKTLHRDISKSGILLTEFYEQLFNEERKEITWNNATMDDMLTRDGVNYFYGLRSYLKEKAGLEGLRLVQPGEPMEDPYLNSVPVTQAINLTKTK